MVMLTSSSHVDLAMPAGAEGGKTCTQSALYFVVFLHNCPHLFHSSRIPDVFTNDAEANDATAALGEGGAVGEFRTLYGAMEEVPQQTLQSIAFPTVFGGSGGLPPMPRRSITATSVTTTITTTESVPWWCRSSRVERHGAPEMNGGGVDSDVTVHQRCRNGVERGAGLPEGPPWSMRLEEMNNAKGVRQCYRIILTARLSALVSSRSAGSMQSRAAAVGLVIACPPHTAHYNFLINHFDCLRALLHRVMDFGLHALHRFFNILLTMPTAPRAQQQQEVLKRVWSQLEQTAEARQTYDDVKNELRHALELALPLVGMQAVPRATPIVSSVCGESCRQLVCLSIANGNHVAQQQQSSGACTAHHVSAAAYSSSLGADALYKSLVRLMAFSADYLTTLIAGVLALNEDSDDGGAGNTTAGSGGSVASGQWPAVGQTMPGMPGPEAVSPVKEAEKEGYVLSRHRKGRVVLFTRDEALAEHLMRVVVFFLTCDDASLTAPHQRSCAEGSEDDSDDVPVPQSSSSSLPSTCTSTLVRHCYSWAIAARANSALSASVPVQWICAEYDDAAAKRIVSEPYSPYNAILLLAPRSLLCRRVVLAKRLRSTTLLLEHLVLYNSNGNSRREVQLRSAPDHFCCDIHSDALVEADAVLGTLVTEALNLHRTTRGAIGCDVVLRRMADWRQAQLSASATIARLGSAQSPTRPPSHPPGESSVSEGVAAEGEGRDDESRSPTSRIASWRSTLLSSSVRRAVTMPLAVRRGSRSTSQLPETDEEQQQLLLPGSQRSRSGRSLLNSKGLLVSPNVFIGDDTRPFATPAGSPRPTRASLPSSPARPPNE